MQNSNFNIEDSSKHVLSPYSMSSAGLGTYTHDLQYLCSVSNPPQILTASYEFKKSKVKLLDPPVSSISS